MHAAIAVSIDRQSIDEPSGSVCIASRAGKPPTKNQGWQPLAIVASYRKNCRFWVVRNLLLLLLFYRAVEPIIRILLIEFFFYCCARWWSYTPKFFCYLPSSDVQSIQIIYALPAAIACAMNADKRDNLYILNPREVQCRSYCYHLSPINWWCVS